MAEFQREHRYWAIKRKHLTAEQDEELRVWIEQIGLPPLECVCVESDWPIYEEVWEDVQRLAEGRPSIGQERDALEAHVERWRAAYIKLTNRVEFADNGEGCYVADGELMQEFDAIAENKPTDSLARLVEDLKEDIRCEVWNEINGPVSPSGEPVLPLPPSMVEQAQRLCHRLEEAGASELLTEASVLAARLADVLRRQAEEKR